MRDCLAQTREAELEWDFFLVPGKLRIVPPIAANATVFTVIYSATESGAGARFLKTQPEKVAQPRDPSA